MDVPNFSNRCLEEKELAPGISNRVKMVSETLNREKYKKLADIISFGVMMKSTLPGARRIRRAS